jgi:Tfp pilus assembly protein PilX
MNWLPKGVLSRERGAALLIVLALVVLLAGLVLAYFSRTTGDRQVAHSSFNQSNADQFAQSAMDNIIGDLRQEIANGSTTTTVNINGTNVTIYTPTSATYMVPQRNVNLAGVYNLIRRSVRSDPILTPPAVPSRASTVNSMIDVSANGRYVTSTRWNGHYLIPKGDVNTSDPSPTPTFNAVTPDWVFVTGDGATVITQPSAAVIGRYAYAIYDEGGLLDANLVGLPSPTPGPVTPAPWPSPSRVLYISRKGTVAFADLTALPLTPGGSTPNPMTISRIVGWRNYATTNVPTNKAFPDLSPSPAPFVMYFLDNTRDFLTVNSPNFLGVTPTPNPKGRTDQAFTTRSNLIQLVLSSIGTSPNLLQYLGTFSREQNAPTWNSASNPISKRFQLDKISLLGSSPTPSPSPGNAPTIKAYFGLQWSSTTRRWQYVGTQGSSLLSAIPTPAPGGSPSPDFFQILNYAIAGQPINKILSLGAAIIDQYDADQVTTGIEYAPAPAVAWGAEDRNPVIPMGSPVPSPSPTPIPGYTLVIQRPFQNVGELGYAYNPISGNTLDFRTTGSSDAALLDFFTYNTTDNTTTYNLPYPLRAGPVNINTRNSAVVAALIKGALPNEPPPGGVSSGAATTAATLIAAATNAQPAISRQDISRLVAAVGTTIGGTEEQRETVARALSDTTQTRTWGLLIDVIAQSGRFKPNASSLQNDFIAEGEQHYWVHVAIDRFTGRVIDKQIEVVNGQ